MSNLGRRANESNLGELKKRFTEADPGKTQFISTEEFKKALTTCGFHDGDRLFKELCLELDPKEHGPIPYQVFLDTLYLTQMYLKEMQLYDTLKEEDKEGKGGVTIT